MSLTGVNPLATYATGVVFVRDAAGNHVNPSSVRVWQSGNGGYSWSDLGSEVDHLDADSNHVVDKPWIAVSQHPSYSGYVYVAWSHIDPSKDMKTLTPNDICFRRSTNGVMQPTSAAWQPAATQAPIAMACKPQPDGTPTDVCRKGANAAQIVEDNNGYVYLFWRTFVPGDTQGRLWGSRSLQPAAEGLLFSKAQLLTTFTALASPGQFTTSSPFIPVDTVPSAAYDSANNRIVLAWHEAEGGTTPGHLLYTDITMIYVAADLSLSITSADLSAINKPLTDQFRPDVATDSNGHVLLTYYDRAVFDEKKNAIVEAATYIETAVLFDSSGAVVDGPAAVGPSCTTNIYLGEYAGAVRRPYGASSGWDIAWNCGDSDSAFKAGSRTILQSILTGSANDCSLAVSASPTLAIAALSLPGTGGTGRIYVSTGTGCPWTATLTGSFLTLSQAAGTGSGYIDVAAPVNTTTGPRSATVTIGGHTITINQGPPPPPCTADSFTLSPLGGFYSSVGGTGTARVTTTTLCSWHASVSTNSPWLRTASSGIGNGTLSFSIDPNAPAGTSTSTSARYGYISVNGTPYVVNQFGVKAGACPVDASGKAKFSIVGPSSITDGQNLSLLAYPGTGYTYAWSKTLTADPTAVTPITGALPEIFVRADNPFYPAVINGAPTTYTYTVTVSTPMCSSPVKVSLDVTVNPRTTTCTLPLFDSGPGGVVVTAFSGQAVTLAVNWLFPPNPLPELEWFQGVEGDESHPLTDDIGAIETAQEVTVHPAGNTSYWVRLRNPLCSNGEIADQWSGTAYIIVSTFITKPHAVPHNLSGIGKTDLILRNHATGANAVLPIDPTATSPFSLIPLPAFDPAFDAQTVSDLNNDGRADIVWRNPSTGANAYWAMSGTQVLSTVPLESKDPAWSMGGSGDFMTDGNLGLLWQNGATNDVELWLMNGSQHIGSFGLGQVPSGDWKLQGAADLDGDGQPDLFFRNYRTGENAVWRMSGPVPPGFSDVNATSAGFSTPAAITGLKATTLSRASPMRGTMIESLPDTNWRVASLADADGDGQNDIIWINSVTGEVMYWQMFGLTHVATVSLPPQTDPNYTIAGVPPIDIPLQTQATALTVAATAAPFTTSSTIIGTLLANGAPVAGETIALSIDGAAVGSVATAADGSYTFAAAVSGLPVGTHSVTAQFAGDAVYAASSASSTVQIVPQAVQLAWATPVPITYGTPLGTAQLSATASVPGTFAYSPGAGTILSAGAGQQLTASFTPADPLDYTGATASTTITVTQGRQTITWPPPASIVYGAPISATQLNASVSVSGPAPAGALTYDTSVGTILSAGDHVLTATAAAMPEYAAASASVTLHVLATTPSMTWHSPAPIVYGTALTATQLNATASVPGTFRYVPTLGTIVSAGEHVLQVTFTPTDTTNFTTATASVTITVTPAIPVLQWAAPADIVYGTALSGTQLNATASVPGTFTYAPAAGTILNAGAAQTLMVSFAPTDTRNYTAVSASVSVNVLKAPQTISWSAPAPIVYGTPLSSAQLNATVSTPGVSAPGALSYTPAVGTILPAGIATLTVSAAETANYTPATASVSLTIRKAVPVITWATPAPITYGTALSGSQLSATANIDGTFAYTPGAGTILDAGQQHLQLTFTPTDSQDYEAATASTTVTVTKAPQQITWAAPAAIVYGTALDAHQLNATVSVVGPAPAGALTYSPAAGMVLDAGPHVLTVTAAETLDYLAATQTVALTVTPAPLTVTAVNATKLYGAPLPALMGTIAGIVNNDPLGPVFTTTATAASPVGTYPITASVADPASRLRNYVVTVTAATLSITPAPLVVTAANVSAQYSDPLPPFGVTYSGFVLGETPAVLTGALSFTTTATPTSAPGTYVLGVGGLGSSNYAIRFVPGTVTITPEDARVTFTGATIGSTTGPATGMATVLLSATVADISATAEANGDVSPGDIRHATLTFIDPATNTPLCTAPLGLVRPDVLTIATGTCTWSRPLTATSTPSVALVVGGYYARNNPADDVVLDLLLPTEHFVTGGGALNATVSGGELAADATSPMSFTVQAEYNTGHTLLHGSLGVQITHTDAQGIVHTYTIAAPALASLGINDTQTAATITAINATITDATDPKNPVVVTSTAILEYTVSQPDKAHAASVGITAWKSDGGLWFATHWAGTQTSEQPIDSGAARIH